MANPLNHIVVGKRKVALFILNKRYVSRIYMNKICIYEKEIYLSFHWKRRLFFLTKKMIFKTQIKYLLIQNFL